ncbi:MAG: NIPSNAP family protein [Terriglobia bacterium]
MPSRQYYELRQFQLRNGYSENPAPTVRPPTAGNVGLFNPVIGGNGPYLLMLLTYASFAEAERIDESAVGYVRYDRTILRAFSGMPELRLPPASSPGHIFELRTYESNNAASLAKKIDMFNHGEMQIFERLGMHPVFFGEALIGSRLPHLSYMLAFDDLAARERLWKTFAADPEWLALRSTPGLSDAEIVSNIQTTILRPLAISDIR